MSYSLNEIETRAKRAARGAGQSWGMAEETGKATGWLASYHLPATALLADLLTHNDQIAHAQTSPQSLDIPWRAPSGRLCPLASGAALVDCIHMLIHAKCITLSTISHPLLIVPFAAWSADAIKHPVSITWRDIQIVTDGIKLSIKGPKNQLSTPSAPSLTCALAPSIDADAQPPDQRGEVDADAWAKLDAFAHRTYAPDTLQSRELGAGAGGNDND